MSEDKLWHTLCQAHNFYYIAQKDGDMGLAPGEAQQKVLRAFDKHAVLHMKFLNSQRFAPGCEETEKYTPDSAPNVAKELPDTSEVEEDLGRVADEADKDSDKGSWITPKLAETPRQDARSSLPEQPVTSKPERPPTISLLNGGTGGNYYWSQTETELTLEMPLREVVCSTSVMVKIGEEFLLCSIPDVGTVLQRTWLRKVKCGGETTWYLDTHRDENYVQKQSLIVEIEKSEKGWWDWPFLEDPPEGWQQPDYKPIPVSLFDLDINQQVGGWQAGRQAGRRVDTPYLTF